MIAIQGCDVDRRHETSHSHHVNRDSFRLSFEAFFDKVSTKGFERNLAQSKDAIASKIGTLKRDGSDVESWLKENKYL